MGQPFLRLVQSDASGAPAPSPRAPVRVLLVLRSLSGGGAERVAINLVKGCDPARVDLRLGLLRRNGDYLGEVGDDQIVSPSSLGSAERSLATAPLDITRMVRATRAEVVMSFGMGVDLLTWSGLRLMGDKRPRWICRQDNNPAAEMVKLPRNPVIRRVVGGAVKHARGDADAVVAVSRDLAERVARRGGAAPLVIYNPMNIAEIEAMAETTPAAAPREGFVVAAGRLIRQKGFDLLLKAFSQSTGARGLKLVILGEGPLREPLLAQAAALGVADRVLMPGFQANPWAWFARARLFVLPSRWEGFGNVVAEAMASGAPTVVTDCDYGPREQVEHGVTGLIAPTGDIEALAATMDVLLANPALAARLAAAGRARARRFDSPTIAGAYTELFQGLARTE